MATRELVRVEDPITDLFFRRIGPHQMWLPGPVVFDVACDGDRVAQVSSQFGFGHKGLERHLESVTWSAAIPWVDRLDSESAVFCEWSFSAAVEQLSGLRVPDRAQWVRLLLLELSRIVSHLRFAVRVARSVGAETAAQYLLRDSERFLDLIEHLTGSRYNPNYICPGGVREDVTEGFVERSMEASEALLARIEEYKRVLLENGSFLKRAAGAGVLSQADLDLCGVTGPNLRASGVPTDLRKQTSGALGGLYGPVEFEVPVGTGQAGRLGDVTDRVSVRFREVVESVRMIQQAAPRIPRGNFRATPRLESLPAGEAYVEVESARGVLGCWVVSRGGDRPFRVRFRPASFASARAFERVARGVALDDFRMVLASLDISPAELDR